MLVKSWIYDKQLCKSPFSGQAILWTGLDEEDWEWQGKLLAELFMWFPWLEIHGRVPCLLVSGQNSCFI